MKQFENMLVTVSEECAEIQQAVSKALRFGLENHHPNNPDATNADDILHEFIQLQALIESLQEHGQLPAWDDFTVQTMKNNKIRNVAKWQEVSFECGTLQGNKPAAFELESVIKQIKDKGRKICCSAKCNNDCENCEHGILMKSIIETINSAANAADGKIGEVRE